MLLWVLQLRQRSIPDLKIRVDIWGSFTVGLVCLFLRWEELNGRKGMQLNMRVRVLKSTCSLSTFIVHRRSTKSFWATFAVLATHSPSLGFCPLHSDEEAAGVTPAEAEKSPEIPCSALTPALNPQPCVHTTAAECSCGDGARDPSQGLALCHHWRSSLDAPSAGSRGSSGRR